MELNLGHRFHPVWACPPKANNRLPMATQLQDTWTSFQQLVVVLIVSPHCLRRFASSLRQRVSFKSVSKRILTLGSQLASLRPDMMGPQRFISDVLFLCHLIWFVFLIISVACFCLLTCYCFYLFTIWNHLKVWIHVFHPSAAPYSSCSCIQAFLNIVRPRSKWFRYGNLIQNSCTSWPSKPCKRTFLNKFCNFRT